MPVTKIKSKWDNGRLIFYDDTTAEHIQSTYPVNFYDDFVGSDVVIPAAASPESGCKWCKKLTNNGTVAKTADGVNGFVACSMTTDTEEQDAELYMNDELMFSIAQGAIFECRLSFTTSPTGNSIGSFGLWGAWKQAGSDYRVGFRVPLGNIVTCESDDNATPLSAASTVTLVQGTYNIFRIDCTDQANIKFYIDGTRVCSSTTFANAASAANSKVQPYIGLYKASGNGAGVISVDYVRVFQNRS